LQFVSLKVAAIQRPCCRT